MLTSKGELYRLAREVVDLAKPGAKDPRGMLHVRASAKLEAHVIKYTLEQDLGFRGVQEAALNGWPIPGDGPDHGCECCKPYGATGFIVNAHERIPCFQCGPIKEAITS